MRGSGLPRRAREPGRERRGNTVSGNYYTPTSYTACGLLFYEAAGVKQQANTLFANEVNLCNFGRGGGKGNPSS